MSENAVDFRLASVPVPQFVQTGVRNSTDSGSFVNVSVSGTASIANAGVVNLSVSSSFTVQSSALKAMAFQGSTLVSITGGSIAGVSASSVSLSNSSWVSGPISSTAVNSSAAAIVAVNSSWQSGPVSSTSLSSTGANLTGGTVNLANIQIGAFTASSGLVTGYFNAITSTGGSVKLAVMST